ncbi:MAG: hypothetical protein LBE34_13045 [Flavobacteriaceae bacterium]|jgi:hypothetical protein|nr:hypothetical protein [Flavobacteriaceae bacterium]
MKRLSVIALVLGITLVSCKDKKKIETIEPLEEVIEFQEPPADAVSSEIVLGVSNFIKDSLLAGVDAKAIPAADRQFKLYTIDLNGDGKKEIFVSLTGTYFCGSGGCTVLLLDSTYKQITKFTVMQTPIFVEPTIENGWKVLTVKSQGEWKSLVFANETYPSNPSVVAKVSYDAPSGHAEAVFDPNKTENVYEF